MYLDLYVHIPVMQWLREDKEAAAVDRGRAGGRADKDARGLCTGQIARQTQLERSWSQDAGAARSQHCWGAEDLRRKPVSVRGNLIRSPGSKELR